MRVKRLLLAQDPDLKQVTLLGSDRTLNLGPGPELAELAIGRDNGAPKIVVLHRESKEVRVLCFGGRLTGGHSCCPEGGERADVFRLNSAQWLLLQSCPMCCGPC